MNTQKNQPSVHGSKTSKSKKITSAVAAGVVALTLPSCDNRGEFVRNGDTINVTDSIINPIAIKFLKEMRDVTNRPRKGGGTLEMQSFDNLYEYIEDEVRDTGEDIRVPVIMTPDMQIDTSISLPGANPYLNYSITAEEKGEGNRHIIISWSANFTKNNKPVVGQLEFINYGDDDQVYMLDNTTGFWRIVTKSDIKKAIDDSIPAL